MGPRSRLGAIVCTVSLAAAAARATEQPYFVTYDHHLEERGSLELGLSTTSGKPEGGNAFTGSLLEIEYGLTGWWTTEVYLEGQATRHESATFTGGRWENRFFPLARGHAVNPVLYVEYEDVTGANKSLKEVVGFDSQEDTAEPVAASREEREREVELKLIVGGDPGGWNVSGNAIAAKNLAGEPWEFGYAFGVSRPLAMAATPRSCRWCAENFRAGVELYGGLGEEGNVTARDTSQYAAAVLGWELGNGATLRLSPAFGLTEAAHPFLLRLGFSWELSGVRR